ncbi:MAG: class I SAM-dependent methyltransferase [Candidatus Binatia bacterium]
MSFGAWYGRVVFPRLMEWALNSDVCSAERRRALAGARGEVLEIGFGTGLNLAHYPSGPAGPAGPAGVTALTIIDSADLLPARVADRIAAAPFPVTRAQLDAERLPFADATFDSVVSTWTLCSIPDPVAALREIRRVLRPDGAFLFLEHGLSDRPEVARWQHRWNPIQRWVACGCNVNRPIDRMIADGGLVVRDLTRFVLPGEISMMAEMYRGTAARP